MNVIDMVNKPSKVLVGDVPLGEPFLSNAGCLYVRCSLNAVVPQVFIKADACFAFHVQTGQVVSFHPREEATRVEAETIIRATL